MPVLIPVPRRHVGLGAARLVYCYGEAGFVMLCAVMLCYAFRKSLIHKLCYML
jgi:hypothetical protein